MFHVSLTCYVGLTTCVLAPLGQRPQNPRIGLPLELQLFILRGCGLQALGSYVMVCYALLSYASVDSLAKRLQE